MRHPSVSRVFHKHKSDTYIDPYKFDNREAVYTRF